MKREHSPDLVDFPAFVMPSGASLWRAHQSDGPVLQFSTSGDGRFDPPAPLGRRYGTCYLSALPTDAFLEKFGRVGPYLTDRTTRNTAVTEIFQPAGTRWADLTNEHAVNDYFTGYDPFQRSDFRLSQRYGDDFHQAGFDGIRYRAHHYGGWESDVFALFGPPRDIPVGEHWRGFEVLKETFMDDLLNEMQSRYGFFVLASDVPE